MKIKTFSLCLLFTCSLSLSAQLSEEDRFEASKNLDIYNSIFNELLLNYVDSIPIEKTTQNNIYSMLRRLDPYTEYIPQESMESFNFMTTGEYGGIGSIISMQEDKIIIREPYEGMPAALAGLRPGDQILEIDDQAMEGEMTTIASERLRGQPNTKVKIKYLRPGETKPKTISIERKRIHIDPVTYYGVLDNYIGYISLSSFTTESAQSVKTVFLELLNEHHITSLIIDVRDNGGGVVEDCLTMLNLFLPKGELLLSMKGRTKQSERIYRATQEALNTEIPLAILVNHNSASASEILAGAIQDYDRGIIVGTRTYGKGLVQATRPLPYDGSLKLTTAKYYIPSGRSIQAIDYAQRDEDGRVTYMPDSLTTTYYTSKGRPVKDGGGILPDYVVEEERTPVIVYHMDARNLFFNFVVDWRIRHPEIASPETFILSDETYEEFVQYAKDQNFTYEPGSGKGLESLKKIMEMEGYWERAATEFTALEEKLKPNPDEDLILYKKEISEYLTYEIMGQYYHRKGQLIYSLRNDIQLNTAIDSLLELRVEN